MHIRLRIEESEENNGGGTFEETEDGEVKCSSSESGDEESDQEVDNSVWRISCWRKFPMNWSDQLLQ